MNFQITNYELNYYFDIILMTNKNDDFFDIYDILVPHYVKVDSYKEKMYYHFLKSKITAYALNNKLFIQFDNGHYKLTNKGKEIKNRGGFLKSKKEDNKGGYMLRIWNLFTENNLLSMIIFYIITELYRHGSLIITSIFK